MANTSDQTSMEEFNRISTARLKAKRACEAAEGTDDYNELLRVFRALDHQREEIVAARRRARA